MLERLRWMLVGAALAGVVGWVASGRPAAAQDLDGIADVTIFQLIRRIAVAEEEQADQAGRSTRALEHIETALERCQ